MSTSSACSVAVGSVLNIVNEINKTNKTQEYKRIKIQIIICLHLVYCVICHSSTWVHCYPLRPLHKDYFRVTPFSTEKENNSQTTSCLINSVHSNFCAQDTKISTNLYKVHLRVETLLHSLVETQRVVSVTKLEKKYLRLLLFGNRPERFVTSCFMTSIHPSNSFGRIAGREERKVRRNNIRFELFGSDLAEKSLFSRCPPSLFPPK